MKLLTKESHIKTVARRWKKQYFWEGEWHNTYFSDSAEVYKALRKELRSTFPDREASINVIIGNDSWTTIGCDECQKDVEILVELGADREHQIQICPDCLRLTLELVKREEEK